jgi:hypothetical protein
MPLVPCLAASLSFSIGATGAAFCQPLDIAWCGTGSRLTRVRGGAWLILPICERGLELIFDAGRCAIVNVLIAWFDVAGYA